MSLVIGLIYGNGADVNFLFWLYGMRLLGLRKKDFGVQHGNSTFSFIVLLFIRYSFLLSLNF